jgi:hypothetical protein
MSKESAAVAQEEEKKEKKVKIKLLRDCMIGEQIEPANSIHMVSEARAKELCDKSFPAYEPYYGNKPGIVGIEGQADVLARQKIVRAVRIA